MKTRVIQTKIWKDNYIGELNRVEKLLFIYLLTNEKVNLCGIYELSDREIKFDLDITEPELQDSKAHLQADGKFIFLNNWVRIINYEKYNTYSGALNETAKERELLLVPKEIQYPIDTLSDFSNSLSNKKSIISNKKQVISNTIGYLKNEVAVKELSEDFPGLEERGIRRKLDELHDYCLSKGKTYKDYRAFARGAIRRDKDNLPKKVAINTPQLEQISDEQRANNLNRLQEMKKNILGGNHV